MSRIHILKFGGTSLQNTSFINQAVELVRNKANEVQPVIVVSAIAGVTDRLIGLAELSVSRTEEARSRIGELRELHANLLTGLGGTSAENFGELESLFDELEAVFFNTKRRAENPKAWRDHVLSIGERASARIFASVLSARELPSVPVDSQHIIKTDASFGEANIIPELTRKLLSDTLQAIDKIAVITGFIGSTQQQEITTLGRSGSDYTAGLIADALKAEQLEIWTDVNGVLTADPRIVPDARNIETLSFEDISELSAHGAKVIHPKTMQPLKDSDISVHVRNSYQPESPGTLIQRNHSSNGDFRSITVTGPFVYFEVPDEHALNLSRFLEEQAIPESGSDGYSSSRISRFEPAQFVIKESVYNNHRIEIEQWAGEKQFDLQTTVNLFRVNTFTNQLRSSDRPVEQILNLLNKAGLRAVRIHREHNRRYFSLLLPEEQAEQAANLINEYLLSGSARNNLNLFLAGVGAVGGKLLEQIVKYRTEKAALNIIGLCNSKKTLWNPEGIQNGDLESQLREGEPTRWPAIIDKLVEGSTQPTLFVDATGSEEVARLYPELLEAGIHIATPSKLANTFEQDYYELLREKAAEHHAFFRYETNVGAGLPIISTLQDLQQSGDTITELSGVVSGTMTYLFNELEAGSPFSEAVIQAKELGYAEPDPRDDLSGEDVARKFLTMGRETGLRIEREELQVESLIPEPLQSVDRETFLNRLHEVDEYWQQRIDEAQKRGETLRYTGRFREGKITIGVESVPGNSSLGQLRGTDNLLRIHSRRYHQTPLIIQGPGAGREVTAAGVLNDILKIRDKIL